MSLANAIAIYFIIWWLTLFAVLPFGARSQAEEGEVVLGTEPGAPHKNKLPKLLLVNSLVAACIFAIFWIITGPLGYSVDDIPSVFPKDLGVK